MKPSTRFVLLAGMMLSCPACTSVDPDPDGDGLTTTEEEAFGSDPNVADTDGDGFDDAEEKELGLDPLSSDTDGDGYLDADEIDKGSDPLDDGSWIYQGGWPYQAHPENINDPGLGAEPARKGDVFANFTLKDQFGDEVSLYDYSQHGKYVILDLSAEWCGPCQGLGLWLSGDPSYADYDYYYPGVRAAINNGDIYYMTVMIDDADVDDDGYYLPANHQTVVEWDEAFPNSEIAVVADKDWLVYFYSDLVYLPMIAILDENMEVYAVNRQEPMSMFGVASELLAEL